jgi:hypothetical protein
MKDSKKFEEFLTDDDYGFIVDSKTGRLKGLWIPENQEDEDVPETIVNICKEYFGVDPNKDQDDSITYH